MVALPSYFAIVSKLFGLELVKQPDREVAATFARLMLDGLRQPASLAAGKTAGANGHPSRRRKQ
jgi:hypothetical protein